MALLTETIEALLWEDESNSLDFKQAQYPLAGATDEQKGEIIKDLLAFANAFRRDDAYILLGVQDVQGGRAMILGVTNHLDHADLQQLVNSKTNRTLDFSYHALEVDGKQVGIIRIPRQDRPTYLRKAYGKLQAETVYLRHGSSTSKARPDEIARMGADQHTITDPRHNPEIAALTNVLHLSRFHERIIRLVEDISHLPDHYITAIAKPPSYEAERRPLHVRFNEDYHAFHQTMSSARDLLTEQQARRAPAEVRAITEILTAMRDVEQTVNALAISSNSRLDTALPSDKQREAAQAADTLTTLVAKRLIALNDAGP